MGSLLKDKFKLIVLSGPSGAGKTTISNEIISQRDDFIVSISATTRQKRPFEIDKKHYFFLSKEEFEDYIQRDLFIEYVKIFDNYYGTLKQFIFDNIKTKNIIFDIDYLGMLKIKDSISKHNGMNKDNQIEFLSIFIQPNSIDDLKKRLEKRGEPLFSIEKRMQRVEEEMSNSKYYDFIIKNENLQMAVSSLKSILEIN